MNSPPLPLTASASARIAPSTKPSSRPPQAPPSARCSSGKSLARDALERMQRGAQQHRRERQRRPRRGVVAGEERAQVEPRVGERGRAKEHPEQADGVKQQQDARKIAPAQRALRRGASPRDGAVQDQQHRRARPPHTRKRPARAVPEPSQQHRQHQVRVACARRRGDCRRAGCRGSRAASSRA